MLRGVSSVRMVGGMTGKQVMAIFGPIVADETKGTVRTGRQASAILRRVLKRAEAGGIPASFLLAVVTRFIRMLTTLQATCEREARRLRKVAKHQA